MKILLLTNDLRATRSGQDAAVWRLARALAARKDTRLRIVSGRVRPGVRAEVKAWGVVSLLWLPSIPIWSGMLQFFSFRLMWRLWGRWIRRRDEVVLATSALWGACDVAQVHFLSAVWRKAAQGRGFSWARRWHALWRHGLAAWLEHAAYRDHERWLVAVSEAVRDDLARVFNRVQRVRVIANPLDASSFRVHTAAPPPWDAAGPPVVLFVGGDWRRKRLDMAFEALACADVPWRLAVVGPGPRTAARRRARELGVLERTLFLGCRDDVPHLYAAVAALLCVSDYETDGLTLWEAFACGCPVIARPIPAFRPHIGPAMPARTAQEAASAVARLLKDDALHARVAAAGLAYCKRRTPGPIAAQMVSVLKEAASAKNASFGV